MKRLTRGVTPEQRLVRDGHISRSTANVLALYLLRCTVADAKGLSYYSSAQSIPCKLAGDSFLRPPKDSA
jgi:hypothetical protein